VRCGGQSAWAREGHAPVRQTNPPISRPACRFSLPPLHPAAPASLDCCAGAKRKGGRGGPAEAPQEAPQAPVLEVVLFSDHAAGRCGGVSDPARLLCGMGECGVGERASGQAGRYGSACVWFGECGHTHASVCVQVCAPYLRSPGRSAGRPHPHHPNPPPPTCRQVPLTTPIEEAWRAADVLQVGGELFDVEFNPPAVEKVRRGGAGGGLCSTGAWHPHALGAAQAGCAALASGLTALLPPPWGRPPHCCCCGAGLLSAALLRASPIFRHTQAVNRCPNSSPRCITAPQASMPLAPWQATPAFATHQCAIGRPRCIMALQASMPPRPMAGFPLLLLCHTSVQRGLPTLPQQQPTLHHGTAGIHAVPPHGRLPTSLPHTSAPLAAHAAPWHRRPPCRAAPWRATPSSRASGCCLRTSGPPASPGRAGCQVGEQAWGCLHATSVSIVGTLPAHVAACGRAGLPLLLDVQAARWGASTQTLGLPGPVKAWDAWGCLHAMSFMSMLPMLQEHCARCSSKRDAWGCLHAMSFMSMLPMLQEQCARCSSKRDAWGCLHAMSFMSMLPMLQEQCARCSSKRDAWGCLHAMSFMSMLLMLQEQCARCSSKRSAPPSNPPPPPPQLPLLLHFSLPAP